MTPAVNFSHSPAGFRRLLLLFCLSTLLIIFFPAADIGRKSPPSRGMEPLNQAAFFNADSGMSVAPKIISVMNASLVYSEPLPEGVGLSAPELFAREALGMDTDDGTQADLAFIQGGQEVRTSINFRERRHMPGSQAGRVIVYYHALQSRGEGPAQGVSVISGISRYISIR